MTKKTGSPQRKGKIRIGIIGCGAIGKSLASAIDRGVLREARLAGLSDHVPEHADRLSRRLTHQVPVLDLETLLNRCDLLIESASASLVPDLVQKAIKKRKDLLIMSTGGLVGQERLLQRLRKAGCRVLFPSGALFGIDGIKAASLLPMKKVVLTTRKPPRSFQGAPFILKHKIRLGAIRRARLLFRGSFEKALRAFPQNINVAETLVLAGVNRRRFEVRIIADPSVKRNSHEVILKGPLGKLTAFAENVPSRVNPKTSRLAILSALAALKSFFDPVRVGT